MQKPSPNIEQNNTPSEDDQNIHPPSQNEAVELAREFEIWSSGIFFMLMGCIFLGFGYFAQQNDDVHASFTFVLIVLGIAILLFGTGTQGVGAFGTGNKNNSPWLTGSIAGGAGLLAACVGFGLVKWQDEIRLAFANHETLYEVPIRINQDGGAPLPDITQYAAIAFEGGEQRPVYRDRQNFVVLLAKPPFERSDSGGNTFVRDTEIDLILFAPANLTGVVTKVEGKFPIEGKRFSSKHTHIVRRNGFRRFSDVTKQASEFWRSKLKVDQTDELDRENENYPNPNEVSDPVKRVISKQLKSNESELN